MKNITLIGKFKGEFNNTPYYKLSFVTDIDPDKGEGALPFVKKTVNFDGTVKSTTCISCTKDFYDFVQIGEVYDSDTLYYNSNGKLVGCFD